MTFRIRKLVASLPSQLEPDAVYLVRVGDGFDLYCTDSTGSVPHKVNTPATEVASFATDAEAAAYAAANPTAVVFSREGA